MFCHKYGEQIGQNGSFHTAYDVAVPVQAMAQQKGEISYVQLSQLQKNQPLQQ